MFEPDPFARSTRRRQTIAVVSAIALVAVGWATPAAAKPKTKAGTGAVCTVVGTNGDDRLTGTAGKDVICGLGGTDTLTGNGGDDVLDGGAGDDLLLGGAGADTLLGGAGTDTVSYAGQPAAVSADLDGAADDGGRGERDRIMADVENLAGGNGNDKLTGSGARNDLRGGPGDDVLAGGGGNDMLNGGNGNDKLNGGDGDDAMTGGPGADDLDGGTGENSCSRDKDDISPENACSDTEAPVVDPASVAFVGPTSFANAQDNIVTLRARVTDARSGVRYVGFQLETPSGTNGGNDQGGRLVSGTRYDGVWEAKVKIPRYAVAGDWHVLAIHTGDPLNHNRTILRDADGSYSSGPGTVPITLGPITVTGDADRDAPVIDTANLAWVGGTEFDNAVDNSVAVDVPITDPQSGVAGVYGWFGSDTTKNWAGPWAQPMKPVSGTIQDGVWRMSAMIPKYAPAGSWRLRQLCAYDDLMNQSCYFANPDGTYRTMSGETATLALPPLTLTGQQSDSTPPVVDLKSFKWHGDHHFSNNTDNIATLRVDIADDLSGVASVSCWLGPVGGRAMAGGSVRLIQGTVHEGTWEFAITLPKFTAAGQYQVTECMFIDRVGNRSGFQAQPDGSYSTLENNMYNGPAVDIDSLKPIEMGETRINP